jgi:hypothetical protein
MYCLSHDGTTPMTEEETCDKSVSRKSSIKDELTGGPTTFVGNSEEMIAFTVDLTQRSRSPSRIRRLFYRLFPLALRRRSSGEVVRGANPPGEAPERQCGVAEASCRNSNV